MGSRTSATVIQFHSIAAAAGMLLILAGAINAAHADQERAQPQGDNRGTELTNRLPLSPSLARMQERREFARRIEKGEIARLRLVGKTGLAAMHSLISEGYSCGLEPPVPWEGGGSDPSLNLPPRIGCTTQVSPAQACEGLEVIVDVQWQDDKASLEGLMEQLPRAKARAVSAACTSTGTRPASFLAKKKAAEAVLRANMQKRMIIGKSADAVFSSMLADGFRCGLSSEKDKHSDVMRCARLPSRTELCYQEEVRFNLATADAREKPNDAFERLSLSKVSGIQVACGLPEIESTGAV